MTFHLVESYDASDALLAVEGRSFPSLCLLEDDLGIRWFLTGDSTFVHAFTWMKAASAGASAILVPADGGYLAMSSESFMDGRKETASGYTVTAPWLRFDSAPTYHQVVAGGDTPEVSQPEDVEEEFVHLHTHSEYSLLDGLSKTKEITAAIVAQGGRSGAIADHGHCAGHPDWQKECDAAGIKAIFAMETYLVENRFTRLEDFTLPEGIDEKSEEGKALRAAFVANLKDYYHLVLIATDEVGLRNLWAMSTEAYRDGMYGKNARLDWDTLARHSEGIVATTACLRGPLTHHALLEGNEQAALERLGRLLEIYGDRLYIEIHTNQLPEQIEVNKRLVAMAREFKVSLLAAVDSHYAKAEDKEAHRVWISMQTDSDVADESSLFAGGQDYHLKTPDEVRQSLAYLGPDVVAESMANTVAVARMCTARVEGKQVMPVFSKKGGAQADADRLLELCLSNWAMTEGKSHTQDQYIARFEHEFPMLVRKGFCGYYLMTAEQTGWAKDNGILVGPGRGSGGGSLVAYLSRITDLDPVERALLFERFMTEGRTALPDFDVDYPATRKRDMQQHARNQYGEDRVAVVGSVMRLKNKGVIKKLSSALASQLPPDWYMSQKRITEIIEDAEGDTAGLGLSWEDLWDKAGEELQPYRDAQPYLFSMADRLVGRVASFGQHAAGMVMVTEGSLVGRLPMRRSAEDGHMIVQFDKDVVEELGFVKFDLLTLRNLDTIQECVDLIRKRRGHEVNVYSWKEEYDDPQVWEEISDAHTLGIFQIETTLGTRYAKRMQPRSLADLADLVTIVRPGPRNSGLTETYLRRRDGLEPVTFPDPRLETVLAKTYGCLLYQEDIMQACMVLGGYDSNEADEVRKILGKKKVEKVAAAGQEFIARATERGMRGEDAAALWSQMAEFAKYSFNRAHAFAYAVLGYWCAWLKFHYPVEFLTAALSGVDKDRIPDFVKEARRMGFQVLPPDVNESGVGFRAGPLSVRYGLDSIKGIGVAAEHIQAAQPFTSFEDFMERLVEPKGSKVDRGHVALLARIGAFDALVPNRRGLETVLLANKTGESTRCVHKTDGSPSYTWVSIDPKTKDERKIVLPCAFDWDSEPVPVNPRTQKKTKPKAPVKACTKACRNYLAPPPMQVEDHEPYTDADIRDIEQELLGVFLSTTPFDEIPEEEREITRAQAEALLAPHAPEALYLIAGVLTKRRPHRTRAGEEMAFLALDTEAGTVDLACFPRSWAKFRQDLKVGDLYVAEVERNGRGQNLYSLMKLA